MGIGKAPAQLRAVGLLALFWNLVGVVMFLMQVNLTPAKIAAMPDRQRLVYEAMPDWLLVPYAMAVLNGALGALGLLLYRRWAVPAFAISLVGVVVQMAGVYAYTPAWEISGVAGLPMAVLLIAVAGFLLWYAQRAADRGWIS